MKSSTGIKVLVVDDHRLVRAGLCRMISDVPDISTIGEVDTGEAAVDFIRHCSLQTLPDVVLMDLRMPGIGGLEATARILRIHPDMRVVVVTMCDGEPYPSQLFRAGACGYVSKAAPPEEIIEGIRKAFHGQRYMSTEVAQAMAMRAFENPESGRFDTLSGREMQIMLMVVNCYKVSQISERLHLSPKTVNSYRYRIFEKLSITSDVELTVLAARHGLLDDQSDAVAAG